MTHYEQSIAKVTGLTDILAVREVEYQMRSNLTGLDHLTKRAFNKLARESAEVCATLGAIAIANYAHNLCQ